MIITGEPRFIRTSTKRPAEIDCSTCYAKRYMKVTESSARDGVFVVDPHERPDETWCEKSGERVSFLTPRFSVVALVHGKMPDGTRAVLTVSRKNDPHDIGMPGGMVEMGESPASAIAREIKEETDIDALEGRFLAVRSDVFAADPSKEVSAICYEITKWEGIARSVEAGVVRWSKLADVLAETCTFREYNLVMFKRAGLLPPWWNLDTREEIQK